VCLFRCQLKLGRHLAQAHLAKNRALNAQKEDKSEVYLTQTMAKRLKDLPLGENYDGIADRDKMKVLLMWY
jgi:hypothetical protein